MSSQNYFASYLLISVTPKRLLKKKRSKKKATFPAEKKSRPIFYKVIEQRKRKGTVH